MSRRDSASPDQPARMRLNAHWRTGDRTPAWACLWRRILQDAVIPAFGHDLAASCDNGDGLPLEDSIPTDADSIGRDERGDVE